MKPQAGAIINARMGLGTAGEERWQVEERGKRTGTAGAAGGMGRDLFGGDVEVVGRLVEDQQIGGLQHHPAQRHAGLLASLQRVQACKRHVTAVAATPEP